jgi:predicted N-acetyltransferase YhbS
MVIRNIEKEDLEEIAELEAKAFPLEIAAGADVFLYRLHAFPESFLVAESDHRIIGFINGGASSQKLITDELFEAGHHCPIGENQMIFGLVVHPVYRNHGVAAALMEHMLQYARKTNKKSVVLTCEEELVPYYERFGFENQGISKSEVGGIVWLDMVMKLK